jgi:hypothetical protein
MKLNVKTSDLPDLFFGVYRLKLNDLSDYVTDQTTRNRPDYM